MPKRRGPATKIGGSRPPAFWLVKQTRGPGNRRRG
jgi:hypothetical protein